MHAVVFGEHRAACVDHGAAAHADAAAEERPGVAGRDEADVVAVGLLGDGQPAAGRLLADLRLGCVADREQRVTQLLGGQHTEHVGLVLVAVDGAAQPTVGQPRVVAGGDGVEAERQRAGRQRGELDPLVAPHAGVGRLAAGVGRHEVVDHVLFELVREIPDVERNVEHVGDPAGVAGILLRAAAPRSGAQRPRRGRQRQVHADHVVARIDHPGGGDRRVDAPAHRDQYPHYSTTPELASAACRARSTAAGSTSSAASTSASTLVWPNESRSEPRALAGSAPIAISTCEG